MCVDVGVTVCVVFVSLVVFSPSRLPPPPPTSSNASYVCVCVCVCVCVWRLYLRGVCRQVDVKVNYLKQRKKSMFLFSCLTYVGDLF